MSRFQLTRGRPGDRRPRAARTGRVGIAVDTRWATVVQVDVGASGRDAYLSARWPLSPPVAGEGWPSLQEVLGELRRDPRCPDSAGFALQRPLCSLKVITLPRLGRDEARRVVEGASKRFFPQIRTALADAVRIGAPAAGGAAFLAAATEAPLVHDLLAEAGRADLRVDGILPALAATAAGVAFLAPEAARGEWLLVLVQEDGVDLLALRKARPTMVRSVPAACLSSPGPGSGEGAAGLLRRAAEFVERAVLEAPDTLWTGGARLMAVGDGISDEAVRLAFGTRAPDPVVIGLEPAVLAAVGAATAGFELPALVPEECHQAARRRRRFRAYGLAGAAAAMFFAAGRLVQADLATRAAEVEERRAVLRPALREGVRTRALLGAVERRGRAVQALDSLRSSNVLLLADLAEVLPGDTYLISLREEGERLRLEGAGRAAVALLPLLEASHRFEDARLEGPVQSEEGEGPARERFVLSVRVIGGAEHPGRGSIR